jgi:hypothetical protein
MWYKPLFLRTKHWRLRECDAARRNQSCGFQMSRSWVYRCDTAWMPLRLAAAASDPRLPRDNTAVLWQQARRAVACSRQLCVFVYHQLQGGIWWTINELCTQLSREAILFTVLDRLWGFQEVWGSKILRQRVHEGGTFVSPTHRPSFSPRKYLWY